MGLCKTMEQGREKVAILIGKWDEAMYHVLGDPTTKPKGYDPMREAVLLWESDKSPTKTRYNLSFVVSLNEITPKDDGQIASNRFKVDT